MVFSTKSPGATTEHIYALVRRAHGDRGIAGEPFTLGTLQVYADEREQCVDPG